MAIDGLENPSRSIGQKIHDGAASAAVTETAGHEAILRDFLAAVRKDRDPCVTADQARLATELILDIYANAV